MKIGIIGAGFTGLAAAHRLSKKGCSVTVFEKESEPGGLAAGFEDRRWKWSLEKYYHHWFYSDWAVRNLAKEVEQGFIYKRPVSSVYVDEKIEQLDSPQALLKFSKLPFFERLRTGLVLSYLKLTPFWKPLESQTAEKFLKKWTGEKSWKILWEPLFEKKFGKYADKIPASWFWARIKKRSPSLGYPLGGFQKFANRVAAEIKKNGGEIFYETSAEAIIRKGKKILVTTEKGKTSFDKVICTLPIPLFLKLTEELPDSYKKRLRTLKEFGAVNLVLALKNRFLEDGTYWLNINERKFPFLALVEHTNFMDSELYGGDRILYVGNYLDSNHIYFKKEAEELLKEFLPFLKKVNPNFTSSWVRKAWVFKAALVQPIIPLNYSKSLPPLETPMDGLYLANIQQVYPWDRGTNYAVELGNKIAELVIREQ